MKKQKSKYRGLQKRKAISGYLFISPFVIGFLVFMLKPFVESLRMSFSYVDIAAGKVDLQWIGISNYYNAFRADPTYYQLLINEFLRMLVYSLAIMVFSFFVALILNSEFKGRAMVRAIFFLPVIMSSGVIIGLETNNAVMANIAEQVDMAAEGINVTAALETILRTAGVGTRAFEKVFEVMDNIYDVAIASGIQIIIYLSGLQTISSSLYEAADIDGCTKWESLWKITFPMISPMLIVNWIYTIIDFCMRTDNEVIKKIDRIMVGNLDYGLASAMSWAYFAIVMAFIGLTSFIISKVVYYND